MTVSLIAAVAANGVIGRQGRLPWKLPDDLARFKALTMGRPVIMGRSTWDSLGRPLAGRRNIVLSRRPGLAISGCVVAGSAGAALRAAEAAAEVFVIGGAAVYALFLPEAQRMYLTWIDAEVPGDAVFPPVDWSQWRVLRETPGDPGAALPHRFVDYERSGR